MRGRLHQGQVASIFQLKYLTSKHCVKLLVYLKSSRFWKTKFVSQFSTTRKFNKLHGYIYSNNSKPWLFLFMQQNKKLRIKKRLLKLSFCDCFQKMFSLSHNNLMNSVLQLFSDLFIWLIRVAFSVHILSIQLHIAGPVMQREMLVYTGNCCMQILCFAFNHRIKTYAPDQRSKSSTLHLNKDTLSQRGAEKKKKKPWNVSLIYPSI